MVGPDETGCTRTPHDESTREKFSTGVCRARHCAGMTSRRPKALRTMPMPGNPRGETIRCICSRSEGGRRRASSVVADSPIILRATALLVRRWDAGGDPEGRSSGKPQPGRRQRQRQRQRPGQSSEHAQDHPPPGHAGQPPRRGDPVHLFPLGRRPPAHEQRGRRPSNQPALGWRASQAEIA